MIYEKTIYLVLLICTAKMGLRDKLIFKYFKYKRQKNNNLCKSLF